MKNSNLLRPDVIDKARGKAKYTSDIALDGMLHGKMLRSPHAHARIKSINIDKALACAGVMAIITGKDYDEIAGEYGVISPDERALHSDKVRYCGDEIAAVAATTEAEAEAALEAIEVEYEILPALFDVDESLSPDAPLIHEDRENNLKDHIYIDVGDVVEAEKNSFYVATGEYITSRQSHISMEPHCCVVDYNVPMNKMTIWSSNQAPFIAQLRMAEMFGLPESNVRVISEYVGGGFGSKVDGFTNLEICAGMLSRKTGRPVRIVNSREEETSATRTRHKMKRKTRMGFDEQGIIQFIREEVQVDNGAYTSFGQGVSWLTCVTAIGPYKIENMSVHVDLVYTNHEPGGAFRGFGNVQSTFSRESLIDEAAEALGIDPLEIRNRNIIRSEDTPCVNAVKHKIDTFAIDKCLQSVADKIRYKDVRKPNEGVGFATMIHWSSSRWGGMVGADNSSATIVVNNDGSVNAFLGYAEIGQGSHMAFRHILNDILKVSPYQIKLTQADTENTPICQGTFGSRGAVIAGSALRIAAIDVRDQMLDAAATLFQVPVETVFLNDDAIFVCKDDPGKSISFGDLTGKIYFSTSTGPARPIVGHGCWDADSELLTSEGGHYAPTYACAAAAVRLSVDKETGKVTLLDLAMAHDVGTILDLSGIEAQIEGGAAQGIGYGLFEDIVYDENGVVLNPSFQDYIIPTFADMPNIIPIAVESGVVPTVPSGVKGLGETGIVCVAPAIANAIYSAVGARVRTLPITPEKILKAL